MKRNALIAATLATLFAAPAGAIGVELENVQITSYQLGTTAGSRPRPAPLGQPIGDKSAIPNEEARPAMMPKATAAAPGGVYNPNTGAFFLKNTHTPGATHPNGVGFLMPDGSVRLVNPSRTAPLTGLPATPGVQAPSPNPAGKSGAFQGAPVRR